MERPEVVDPLKEEEQQPIFRQTPVEEPEPVDTQTEDAFSVRGLAEKRFGEIGTSALDFVPIVGDVLAAGDVVESARKGDVLGTAINVAALGVGLVPIVGDLAAKGLKQGLKKYEKVSTTNKDVIDTPVKDAAEIGDPAEVIALKGANTKFLSNQKKIDKGEKVFDGKTVIDKNKEVFKTFDNLFEEAKIANPEKSDDVISWEIQSKINQEGYRKETGIDVVSRTEPLEQAALRYYDKVEKGGDPVKARLEYLEILEKLKPIREWDDIPLLTSPKQQVLGLNSAQRKSGKFIDIPNKDVKEIERILGHPLNVVKLDKGQIVEGRLDITAYKNYNAWITTLSGTGIKGQIYGDALHYVSPEGGKVLFKAKEEKARNILTRQPLKVDPDTGEVIKYYEKTPFGVIRGAYNPMSPKEIRQKVKKLLKDPEWTQVGFDPRRLTTFYTRSNRDKYDVGSLVESADEVFQIGPLVLAKNIKLLDQAAQPRLNKGGAIKTYKEGGVVPMQEQMKFAFMNEGGVLADDGVNRDPVSGNEVPSGSMAKEVRDDVPAMLSEGEYVVPADVVRYHGIDKFEELRDEAKVGLARMEADGRIGGQPVEEQEEFPFPVEELEGFNEGGAVGDTYSDVTGSDFKPNQPYGAGGGRFPGVGFELRNFTNPKTGKTVVIPFFNNRSMQYIPPDFLEGGATTTRGGTFDPAADERSRQEDEAERARQVGQTGLTPLAQDVVNKVLAGESTGQQTKPFSQYSPEEFGTYLKQRQSGIGQFIDNLPILGPLLTMQDNSAREFARKSLIQGKNFVTGEPISNKEADILMQVADMPEGRSFLQVIDDFLQGKTSSPGGTYKGTKPIVIDDRPPIDTELRRTTYEPKTPVDTTTKPQERPQTLGVPFTQPTQEYYGPGSFQNIIEPQEVQTVDAKPSAFDMSATAQVVSQDVKEGLFYNPGNIEIGQNYAGEIGTYADGRFAQFSAPQFGVRALAVDMKTKAERYNNDVESMLLEYLGGGRSGSRTSRYKKAEIENPNARVYIRNAVNAVGNKKIDTSNVKQMKGLVEQIIKNENTKQIADFYLNQPNVIEEGIVLSQKSFPKETKLADARKSLSGELFQAGLVKQPLAMPVGLGETAVAGEASQPLTQTFVPPQAPTAEQIRLAGGVDAFVKSQLPISPEYMTSMGRDLTRPVEPEPLQDLPVGVSIEADGQFTGTGGLGAVQQFPTQLGEQQTGFGQLPTPVVKRDYELPGSLSEQEVMRRPTTFTGPTGAGIGPMSEDEKIKLDLGKSYTDPYGAVSFRDNRNFINANLQPSISSPAIDQTAAMLGGTGTSGTLPQVGPTAPQPVAPFTPLGRPSDISRLMPTTADIQAQQAADARKAREEQERMIYEETQKRIPTTTQTDDQPDTPELRDLKQRAQTRDAAKKSRQMNQARQDVIMGGGSAFEADAAAQAVFLDQSDEIRRNQELNKGKTLTQVLQEEESREEESSGGGGFGGGDTGGSDKSIVCTEIYRQTQLPNWSKAMRVWDTYQRRYLTPEHEIGYHWLFKPYVSGMKKSNLLTRFGALMAGRRTQHLKHVLTKGKAKDDLFGNVFCKIIHPTVYVAGKIKNFLDGKTKAT